MTNDNYSQIPWPEVRKGDVLFHENGDRLTVTERVDAPLHGATFTELYTFRSLAFTSGELQEAGFTPYRRKPEMPTASGAYLDKDGGYWLLDKYGSWYDWTTLQQPEFDPDDPHAYAPFTRLVPMPTEEQVREAAHSGLADRSEFAATAVTDAVMALLNGEGDDE